METLLQNVADTVMAQAMKIQTTLYDLVATLNAELSPDEDNILNSDYRASLKHAPGYLHWSAAGIPAGL